MLPVLHVHDLALEAGGEDHPELLPRRICFRPKKKTADPNVASRPCVSLAEWMAQKKSKSYVYH